MSHEEARNPESLKNTQLSKSLMRRMKDVFFVQNFFYILLKKIMGSLVKMARVLCFRYCSYIEMEGCE